MSASVTTYYVQMFAHPQRRVEPPRDGLQVIHARNPSVAYYRFLYDEVGRDWSWGSRKKLSDDALAAILADPLHELHVLFVEGTSAGFVEMDRRTVGEIEIVQFGLTPEFIGQGLGRYFLSWTVDRAWSYAPQRLWLHTCTNDHPIALSDYLKAGFCVYREEVKSGEGPVA